MNDATQLAKRIAHALQAPFIVEGQELLVTISIGVALSSTAGDELGTLLQNADLAIFQAKGKNQYTVFDSE